MGREMRVGEAEFVSRSRRLSFRNPVETVCARTIEEVRACLAYLERQVARGLHAAGFIAYEAAPAFDAALVAHPAGDFPLLWFGLYAAADEAPVGEVAAAAIAGPAGAWQPLVVESQYHAAIAAIRDLIASGDTYQVNYTFPFETPYAGEGYAWFERLCLAQRADYCAFVHAGRYQVLSASPELFFSLEGEVLSARPMKGTRPRGRWSQEDRRLAAALAASEKDRAENVMIVDLLRSDIGRVAETGSVTVPRLFDVERYETVWQMTSTVSAKTRAGIPEILAALFPCGSVTGAPKVRTMEIIRALEPHPRGVYCGAIGWWSPERRAAFNVAIRTVVLDAETGLARYNVGGGITWDSTSHGEYDECFVKAAVLSAQQPEFDLIESLRFEEGRYFLLDYHLARLADSADYFGFALDRARVDDALCAAAARLAQPGSVWKVRLTLNRRGDVRITEEPAQPSRALRVGFAREPVDAGDRFLFHKTTHRAVYERAKASRPDCDDVLLWNRRGAITESTIANIVLDLDGKRVTPPIEAGLLGGTLRAHLLAEGAIEEWYLTKADVLRADAVHLINSVRKWIPAELVDRAG